MLTDGEEGRKRKEPPSQREGLIYIKPHTAIGAVVTVGGSLEPWQRVDFGVSPGSASYSFPWDSQDYTPSAMAVTAEY